MPLFLPLLKDRRIVAAKIETTVGTPVALTGADAIANCFDAEIQCDTDTEQRAAQGSFSSLSAVVGADWGTMKFKTELIGGAALPWWMSVLMPACAFPFTGLVGAPQTRAPGGGNVKTVTIGLFEDGLFKSLCGAMGNPVFTFLSGKRTLIEFTFQGVWIPPTDVGLPSPSFVTTPPLKFINSALLVGGAWTPRVSQLTLDLGNDIQKREDSTTNGYINAYVAGRKVKGKFDPESTLLASGAGQGDVYGQFRAGVEQTLALSLGSAGNAVAIAAPKMQYIKPQEGDRNKLQIDQIDFQLNRSAAAGDDELTITSS